MNFLPFTWQYWPIEFRTGIINILQKYKMIRNDETTKFDT